MWLTRRPSSRAARTSATLTVLTVLLLAATAGLALAAARTTSCAQISNCATVLTSTPPPTATLGGPIPPASRFSVAVRTPPTSTLTGSQPGQLVTNALSGRRIRCRGYRTRAPATFAFKLLTATPVNITYDITDRITNTTAQGIGFCLAANFPFKTASGAQAPATRLPDGTRGHVGLLPMCAVPLPPAGVSVVPCIEKITTVKDSGSSTGVDVILKVRVPTRTKGDPWGAG